MARILTIQAKRMSKGKKKHTEDNKEIEWQLKKQQEEYKKTMKMMRIYNKFARKITPDQCRDRKLLIKSKLLLTFRMSRVNRGSEELRKELQDSLKSSIEL